MVRLSGMNNGLRKIGHNLWELHCIALHCTALQCTSYQSLALNVNVTEAPSLIDKTSAQQINLEKERSDHVSYLNKKGKTITERKQILLSQVMIYSSASQMSTTHY